jgi:hypothetical protein
VELRSEEAAVAGRGIGLHWNEWRPRSFSDRLRLDMTAARAAWRMASELQNNIVFTVLSDKRKS